MVTLSSSRRRKSLREGKPKMSKFEKQVNDLLQRAMEQPGVAEAMRVYQSQQPALKAYSEAQSAIAPRWVVSSSTSSVTHNA